MESEKTSSLDDIQSKNDDFTQSVDNEMSQQQLSNKNSTLKITGILLILVGIFIIVHWIYILITPEFIDSLMNTGIYNNMNITREDIATVYNFCGLLAMGLSFFTIMGGILALKRQMFWFAVIGGIFGIFAIAPLFFFIPNILSLIGVIFVIRSRKDFELTPKDYQRNY